MYKKRNFYGADEFVKKSIPEVEKLYAEISDYIRNDAAKDLSESTKDLVKEFWSILQDTTNTSDTLDVPPKKDTKNDKVNVDGTVKEPETKGHEFNIADLEDSVEITIAVPGFKANDIEITYDDSLLKIIGTSDIVKQSNYAVCNIDLGDFKKVFKLLRPVSEINYTIENGLLTIIVHFTIKSEPKIKYFNR
jgi:HSP20 family molecular chaperone IbpA